MNNNLKSIYKAFDGKLVGKSDMKMHVCKTLSLLPESTINLVTKNCWFISSMDDAWAFAFTGNDLKDQHMVFLSDELFLESETQIHWTIAHEIAHVVLNHRNSTLVIQSKDEIQQQENEADTFAAKYLPSPH